MTQVTSSKFFQDRAFLIQELGLNKCPKKTGCANLGERICRLWRSICEYFSPKIYQKKLGKQLQEIKKELEEGMYQKKIESFYKKFVQEAKEEVRGPFELSPFSLDSRESIEQLTSQLQRLGQPMQGKLLLISDCFEWKEKMIEQRKEVLRQVEGAKVRNSASYDRISWMIKKVKDLVLNQSKDVKSYAYFMREFASASSNLIIQEANWSLSQLEQDKNKSFEKFLEEKKKIQACIEKLKQKTHPSTSRMSDLKGKRKAVESRLNATKSSYSELYGEWSREMDEIKTTMSRKICSDNWGVLAFWKKKLNDLVKSKEHLDPVIEMLIRLDRICLTLESSTDPNGVKLLNSGLGLSLKEAALVALREWSDSPKHIHDQISKHLRSLIGRRVAFLEEKIGKFLPQLVLTPLLMSEDEKLISELENGGLKRHPIQKEANCLFNACVKGGLAMSGAPVVFKALDGGAFRKALYEYMKTNREVYLIPLVKQLKEDLTPMVLISEEFAQKGLSDDKLEVWLLREGVHKYLEAMGSCNAYAGEVELEAVSKMVNVPIRVYSESYPRPYKDIGEYPLDRTKALHLFRTKSGHYDALTPVETG